MPDYNKAATLFWCCVCLGGVVVVAQALAVLWTQGTTAWVLTVAGMLAAMTAGLFPIRVPLSKNSFVAGEIIIFLLLLNLGPSAATVASAGEAAMGAYRTSKRWTSRLISPANTALSMAAAGWLFEAASGRLVALHLNDASTLLLAAIGSAFVYFLLSAIGISGVQRLKRGEPFLSVHDLFGVFHWVGLAFTASACVAALLTVAYRHAGPSVLVAVLPLLAMFIVTLHFYFREQESREEVRQAINDIAAREATMASREADAAMRYMLKLQDSEARFHAAFTHAQIGMVLMSFEGRILQANQAICSLLGLNQDDLAGTLFQDRIVDDDKATFEHGLTLARGSDFQGLSSDLSLRCSNGQVVWTTIECGAFLEPRADQPCLILQVQDVTARRQTEARLQYLAYHDSLTGLPNRRRFLEWLEGAIERSKLDRTNAFALLFLDFDGLKTVNETWGHQGGDDVLVQVAWRLRQHLRPGDVLARLGGDEFGLLVQLEVSPDEAKVVADRIEGALREPFDGQGGEVTLVPYIGMTHSGCGHGDVDAALRAADAALQRSRRQGAAVASTALDG